MAPSIQRPLVPNQTALSPDHLAPVQTNPAADQAPTIATTDNHNAIQFKNNTSYANNTRGVFGTRATQLIVSNKLSPEAADICDRAYEYLNPASTNPSDLTRACNAALRRNS